MQSVTSEIRAEFQRYGQSNNTKPSFVWPQFVRHNTLGSARALGSSNDLFVTLTGSIGSQVGAPTQFFAVNLPEPGYLRVMRNDVNRYTDKYIFVGLCDTSAHSIHLDDQGFAYQDQSLPHQLNDDPRLLPAGDYFFSVASSEWVAIPYSISIEAFSMISISELPLATSQSPGIVQLSTSLFDNSTDRAATAATVNALYSSATNAVALSEQALNSVDGLKPQVQTLSQTVSDQQGEIDTAVEKAGSAEQNAQQAEQIASSALQASGGTITGELTFGSTGVFRITSFAPLPES